MAAGCTCGRRCSLLPYNLTALLPYDLTILLSYYLTILPSYRLTILPSYHLTALQRCPPPHPDDLPVSSHEQERTARYSPPLSTSIRRRKGEGNRPPPQEEASYPYP
eukprot:scaffold101614_cov36-Phaeocystis_antarctica.AAC.1